MAKKKDEYESYESEEWSAEDNEWYQKAKEAAKALDERSPFSYDPGADPLYNSAKAQYVRLGKRAMEDTMGQAAGLSGGYASSYAQTQGSQAYDERLSRLTELLPDYYDRARSAYDKETASMRDALGTALGFYDKDYQAWLDRQSARERAEAAETKKDQWEREFAEDHERWEAEQEADAAGRARSDEKTNRSYAYRMAMLALQQGLPVSDELLAAAGIDKAYAETIRRYYYNLHH